MTVCVDSASNMPVERPAGPHSLAAAAHCRRSPELSRARREGVGLSETEEDPMRNEFTAVVERDGRWHIAYCPEIPGANGQGRSKAAALKSLVEAISLILEDRRKDSLRGVPASARREKVVVG